MISPLTSFGLSSPPPTKQTQLKPQSQLAFFSDKDHYNPQKTWGDYLAIGTTSISIVGNLFLFATPWIARFAKRSPQSFNNILKGLLSPKKQKQFLATLQNEQGLARFFQSKVSNTAYLLQQNTGFQTGIYTQQPTKIYGALITTPILLFGLVKYRPILDSVQNVGSFLWFVGETNDIHNNVDPAHRREWDPKRLKHPFNPAPDGSKTMLESAVKSLMRDCAYPLSMKPWKELYQCIKNYKQTDWESPKSCETAIGAQLQLVTFIGSIWAYLLSQKGSRFLRQETADILSKSLTTLSKYSVLASAISFIPVFMRAWQNRKQQSSSFLTLLGVPLAATYQVLNVSPLRVDPRKGLFVVGFPLINEGNLCNSERYRNQVNYLKFIYSTAVQNPQLKADDFLSYLHADTQETKMMTKAMGQHKVDYVMETLNKSKLQQQKNNISLSVYLKEVMQDNGNLKKTSGS